MTEDTNLRECDATEIRELDVAEIDAVSGGVIIVDWDGNIVYRSK